MKTVGHCPTAPQGVSPLDPVAIAFHAMEGTNNKRYFPAKRSFAAIKFRVKPFSKGLREFEGRAIKVLLGCGTEFRDFRGEVEEQYPDRDVE